MFISVQFRSKYHKQCVIKCTNNHVPNFRCLPTFLLFIFKKLEANKKKQVCTLVLLCITKKKLLIKVAYLSKFYYHTPSCDPKSKVASFSPRAYQRPRCVRRVVCRLLQLARSNRGLEFYSDTEGISTCLLCLYCLMLVRPCSRSIPHQSSSIKWVHTRLWTRKLGSPGPNWPSAPQLQNRPHLTSSRVHYAVRLLLIVGHNLWYWCDPQRRYDYSNFCENLLTCDVSHDGRHRNKHSSL
jgi:hypothetical protein